MVRRQIEWEGKGRLQGKEETGEKLGRKEMMVRKSKTEIEEEGVSKTEA